VLVDFAPIRFIFANLFPSLHVCEGWGERATDWVSWLWPLCTHTSSKVTWHQSNSVTTSLGESWQQQTRASL